MEYSEEEQKYRAKLIREIEEMRVELSNDKPELKVIQGERQ
jgi:hypothetical protein